MQIKQQLDILFYPADNHLFISPWTDIYNVLYPTLKWWPVLRRPDMISKHGIMSRHRTTLWLFLSHLQAHKAIKRKREGLYCKVDPARHVCSIFGYCILGTMYWKVRNLKLGCAGLYHIVEAGGRLSLNLYLYTKDNKIRDDSR